MNDPSSDGDGSVLATGEPGRLVSETVEERRARLVAPRRSGSRAWRRFNLALIVVVALLALLFSGVLPGSAVVGRYPVWKLYALESKLDSTPFAETSCGPVWVSDAAVDLVRGRVVVPQEDPGPSTSLSEDELAMIVFDEGAYPATRVEVRRIVAGAPGLCITTT